MKTITTALLVITFVFVVGSGQQAHSSEPPAVNLHIASLQGNFDAVQQHIQAGSNLNETDAYGSTPLIIAITFGTTDVAEALIEAGADLNIRDNNGSTPLHLATFFCRPEIVKTLLDNDANKYVRNNSGATAFDIAASPFDDDKGIYDNLKQSLGSLGLELDYEQMRMTRPRIADMLRPQPEELETVDYTPLPGDDWKVSTPEEQGVDPNRVAELFLDAVELKTLYSLLVIKNGYLVAEEYFNEGAVEQKARLQSVTKSYTSALVGIALEQGCLSSVDQKMLEFFPEVAGQITDLRKKQITIRQLLQMRAGYPWEETDPAFWNGLLSGDYLPLIGNFPLVADPGTEFHYSNLSSNWLGIILDRACGTRLKPYAEKHLFDPLGVQAGAWGTDREGHNNGCGDLHLTARDAAKLGLLYLNDGEYEGKQIVSASWVRESLQRYSEDVNSAGILSGKVGRYFRDIGYGYQWWSARVGEHHFTLAWGHGGQFIVLLDELDMILVTTAAPFWLQHDDQAWKHERSIINLLGKFINSLPNSK